MSSRLLCRVSLQGEERLTCRAQQGNQFHQFHVSLSYLWSQVIVAFLENQANWKYKTTHQLHFNACLLFKCTNARDTVTSWDKPSPPHLFASVFTVQIKWVDQYFLFLSAVSQVSFAGVGQNYLSGLGHTWVSVIISQQPAESLNDTAHPTR